MKNYIGTIAIEAPTLSLQATGRQAERIFSEKTTAEAIVVLSQEKIQGFISRSSFFCQMGTKYGYVLYSNRSVEHLMDASPLVLSFYDSIGEAADLAMRRPLEKLYEPLLVLKDSKLFGMVSIQALLLTFARILQEEAKQMNPLTGLLGNLATEEAIRQALFCPAYSVLYFDLDHFKPYNDHYGFGQGDRVLRFTADCLQKAAAQSLNPVFVGHIGGDDFVCILYQEDYRFFVEAVFEKFQAGISAFYADQDWQKGFIDGENRQGEKTRYAILSLSAGIVSSRGKAAGSLSYEQFQELAVKAKKNAKKVSGNSVNAL